MSSVEAEHEELAKAEAEYWKIVRHASHRCLLVLGWLLFSFVLPPMRRLLSVFFHCRNACTGPDWRQ